MKNDEWIFIKIFMDAIVNAEKETEKFVKNVRCKSEYFDIFIEYKSSIMPCEELIEELKITDKYIIDKFYNFVDNEIFNKRYTDETLHFLFEGFANKIVNYKTIIKILFSSLIKFETEINSIIKHIEGNDQLIEITGEQVKAVVPIEKLMNILQLSEKECNEFIDKLMILFEHSSNQDILVENFLKTYGII